MTKISPPSRRLRLTAPIVTVSPTVSKLLARIAKGGRIRRSEFARVLAAISAHVEHGVVPAHFQPAEIFALIGEALVSHEMWSEFHNAARAEAARLHRTRWQYQAEKLWRQNRRLTKSQVAKKISPGRWQTVRRVITKPPK